MPPFYGILPTPPYGCRARRRRFIRRSVVATIILPITARTTMRELPISASACWRLSLPKRPIRPLFTVINPSPCLPRLGSRPSVIMRGILILATTMMRWITCSGPAICTPISLSPLALRWAGLRIQEEFIPMGSLMGSP